MLFDTFRSRIAACTSAALLGLTLGLATPVTALAEEATPEINNRADTEALTTESTAQEAVFATASEGPAAETDSSTVGASSPTQLEDERPSLQPAGETESTGPSSSSTDTQEATVLAPAEDDPFAAPAQDAPELDATVVDPLLPAADDTPAPETPAPTLPTNKTAIETGLSYGKLLDAKGGKTANKTNVQLYQSNNTSAQRWVLEAYKDGYYIVNVKSGKVLDVAGGKAKRGTNVQLYQKNGSKAQLWQAEATENGGWILHSLLGNNLVLDISGARTTNGANLQVWTANGSKAQTFWFREQNPAMEAGERALKDGAYLIQTAKGEGKVVDVKGGSTSKGANIQLYAANDTNAQRFYATFADGFYTFQSVVSGLALDVSGASPIAGANVQLYTPNHTAAQQWRLTSAGNGSFTLTNRGTGLVLDLAGGKLTNSTNIQGYYANGSAAQSWVFDATTLVADGIYTLKDAASGKVLDISGGSTAAGAAVQRYASNGSMAQKFMIETASDGMTQIRNIGSAKWVSDSGSDIVQAASKDTWKLVWNGSGITVSNGTRFLGFSKLNKATTVAASSAARITPVSAKLLPAGYYQLKSQLGTALDIDKQSTKTAYANASTSSSSLSQAWKVETRGGDTFSFINVRSGLALEVASTSTANGVRARQASYTGAKTQLWQVVWNEKNGGIILKNVATGKVLDVAGASTKSGTKVQQYAASGSIAQSWITVDKRLVVMRDRIAQVSEHFADHDAHGYSIPNRGEGGKETITVSDGTKVTISKADVDCSELVRQCINAVLGYNKIDYLDTRIEDAVLKANGFTKTFYKTSLVQRGDILWHYGHTGVALGGGKQSEAYWDEYHDANGYNRGDQTGDEVRIKSLVSDWTYIYRYTG